MVRYDRCIVCGAEFKTYLEYRDHRCDYGPLFDRVPVPQMPKLSANYPQVPVHETHKHQTWVPIGQWEVGAMSSQGKLDADILVYLDMAWLGVGDILTGYRSRIGRTMAIYVKWPDATVLPMPSYRRLVYYLAARVRAGKKVAIGCIGGHGRTGTVLAGLIKVLEHRRGGDAIAEIRKRYCNRAVETKGQENMVRKL